MQKTDGCARERRHPGSRSPVLFLVELGAPIKVASTTVLVLGVRPLVAKMALMVVINWILRLPAITWYGDAGSCKLPGLRVDVSPAFAMKASF
jgi:hypothetical protein